MSKRAAISDKRESLQEGESYNHTSRDEFRGNFRGGRGSHRGSYRGGYRRDDYSPYRRESHTYGTSTPSSRANSLNDSNSYQKSPEVYNRSPYRKEPEKLSYKSPWVELLNLDATKCDDPETRAKIKELGDEQEVVYIEQEKIEAKIKEQKIKNLKLEMEVAVLRATAQKDSLNVESTQEKLDTISFL